MKMNVFLSFVSIYFVTLVNLPIIGECIASSDGNITGSVTTPDRGVKVEMEKYALLISISKYPRSSGWPELHSDRDLYYLKSSLIGQGFKEGNIFIVKERDATRAGIKKMFDKLIQAASKDAQIVIHYSGHGQQIYDDNGDELDKLDESIVAYGAPMKVTYDEYKGDKHIRDDELGEWLTSLRTKIGRLGHVLVILDSCNSGTGYKGSDAPVSRGGDPILPKQGFPLSEIKNNDISGFEDALTVTQNTALMGRLVLFCAAGANQPDFETRNEDGFPIGPLSFAVSKVFKKIGPKATYRSLFAEIQNYMSISSPYQTPGLEGDADFEVLSGTQIVQQSYFAIDRIIKDSIFVAAGTFVGAGKGATIGFYKLGTASPNPSNFIAEGKVVDGTPFNSKVILTRGKITSPNEQVWAFVLKQSFNDWAVTIALDSSIDKAQKNALADSLKNLQIIRLADKATAQMLIKGGSNSSDLSLLLNQGEIPIMHTIRGKTAEESIVQAIAQIKIFCIGQFLKEFEVVNSKYEVSIDLYESERKDKSAEKVLSRGNVPQFNVGKIVSVTIRNDGKEAFYYNVLDFQPNGIVNVTVPKLNAFEPTELKLEKGQSATFRIKISKPTGIETNRVFVSSQPFDLRLAFGFFNARGPESPIEKLLQSAMAKTKGTDLDFDASSSGVASFTFEITDPH